jgi:hypothetical protein
MPKPLAIAHTSDIAAAEMDRPSPVSPLKATAAPGTTAATVAGSPSEPPPNGSAKKDKQFVRVLAPAGAALAYTVADAALISGLSRTRLYQLFSEGVLTPKRAGRRTLILADELRDVVRNLPSAPVRRRKLAKPT